MVHHSSNTTPFTIIFVSFLSLLLIQNTISQSTPAPSIPTIQAIPNPTDHPTPYQPCCQCLDHNANTEWCPYDLLCRELICNSTFDDYYYQYCCTQTPDERCLIRANAICYELPIDALCCACTEQTSYSGCPADIECQVEICNDDPTCCDTNGYQWDDVCTREAQDICAANSVNPTLSPTKLPTQTPSDYPTAEPTDRPTSAPTAAPTLTPTVDTVNPSIYPTFNPTTSAPTKVPTSNPTVFPTSNPSFIPTISPTNIPTTRVPSLDPSYNPTSHPSFTLSPSLTPSLIPSLNPSIPPTLSPSNDPSVIPTFNPSILPSVYPTYVPSVSPTYNPSDSPSLNPTSIPSISPSYNPSVFPSVSPSTNNPSLFPSVLPTVNPTNIPSFAPTQDPSAIPSISPTLNPTINPSMYPSFNPSINPSLSPTLNPSIYPSFNPSIDPSSSPTLNPTTNPSISPSFNPSTDPSVSPTLNPSTDPSISPTLNPTTNPSISPSFNPSTNPTLSPTRNPANDPTVSPTLNPSGIPSFTPTHNPSRIPSFNPTQNPSLIPSFSPTNNPSYNPSLNPTVFPTQDPSYIPSASPTLIPTHNPSLIPSSNPTAIPSRTPTDPPTRIPTDDPSISPSTGPTATTTTDPTLEPTFDPTFSPTNISIAPGPGCIDCDEYLIELINIKEEEESIDTTSCDYWQYKSRYSDSSNHRWRRHRRHSKRHHGMRNKCASHNGWSESSSSSRRRRRLSTNGCDEDSDDDYSERIRSKSWYRSKDSSDSDDDGEGFYEVCLTYSVKQYDLENECGLLNAVFLSLCNDTDYNARNLSTDDVDNIILSVAPDGLSANGAEFDDSLGIMVHINEYDIDEFILCLKNVSVDDNYITNDFEGITTSDWVILNVKEDDKRCINSDGLPCINYVFNKKCNSECECNDGLNTISTKYIGDNLASMIVFYYDLNEIEECIFYNVLLNDLIVCSLDSSSKYSQFEAETEFIVFYSNDTECKGAIVSDCSSDIAIKYCNELSLIGWKDIDDNVCTLDKDVSVVYDGNNGNALIDNDKMYQTFNIIAYSLNSKWKTEIIIIFSVLCGLMFIAFYYLVYSTKLLYKYNEERPVDPTLIKVTDYDNDDDDYYSEDEEEIEYNENECLTTTDSS